MTTAHQLAAALGFDPTNPVAMATCAALAQNLTERPTMPSHTSAPWNPYSTFAHLVIGDPGVRLSAEDYDFAARCINVHDALVEAAELATGGESIVGDAPTGTAIIPLAAYNSLCDALAAAKRNQP